MISSRLKDNPKGFIIIDILARITRIPVRILILIDY